MDADSETSHDPQVLRRIILANNQLLEQKEAEIKRLKVELARVTAQVAKAAVSRCEEPTLVKVAFFADLPEEIIVMIFEQTDFATRQKIRRYALHFYSRIRLECCWLFV